MNGLNGDRVFTARDVPVGRVSGETYGYKRTLAVTVDVRMERLTRQDAYETTAHAKVRRPLDFAITTAVWRPDGRDIVAGGATVEPLRELVSYANGFDEQAVAELLSLAPYHLNGMSAACDHQKGGTEACPEGYRYGSKWLVRELPDGFLSRVRQVFAATTDRTRISDAESE